MLKSHDFTEDLLENSIFSFNKKVITTKNMVMQ